MGPLAHLLKNRFYLGEVVYRGEICRGEHAPILERDLFEAVQQRLKVQAVERSNRRLSSTALLAGKLFDDRGNPMTPTYANKKGVRYRYYVSHALLQGRKADAGCVARVSAPEVEKLVIDTLRVNGDVETEASDRELIDLRLRRATVGPDSIAIHLKVPDAKDGEEQGAMELLLIPFSPPLLPRKGVAHAPAQNGLLSDAGRAALLTAIARAKSWAELAIKDPAFDFSTLAAKEKLSERYIRLLTPLAFLSPKVIDAIVDGEVPADLTPTTLSQKLPLVWAEQERRLQLKP